MATKKTAEQEKKELDEKIEEIKEKEEKESFFQKVGNKVKSGCGKVKAFAAKHPVATFITGTVVGSAATVGTAIVVDKVIHRDDNVDFGEDPALLGDGDYSSEATVDVDVNDTNVDV